MTTHKTNNEYYIVSIKHTSKGDAALTLWCANARGYSWDKKIAGIYYDDNIEEFVNEDNIAVKKEIADKYWQEANDFGDRYTSIPNTKAVREALGLSTKLMKASRFATCRMRFVDVPIDNQNKSH